MCKRTGILLSAGVALAGLVCLALSLYRPITIVNDGQKQIVEALALTSDQTLHSLGITLGPGDRLSPSAGHWLGWNSAILIEHTRSFTFWMANGVMTPVLKSADRIPSNLALLVGIHLFPGDVIRWNGHTVPLNQPLQPAAQYILQYQAGVPLTLVENGQKRVIYTTAGTIGEALQQAGIQLGPQDRLSIPVETALNGPQTVTLQRAAPITITVDGQQILTQSAAASVGQALAENGLALQGLDFSIPSESQPLPANGAIRVVRVREEIILQQTAIPFQSDTLPDASLDMDQQKIVQAGQPGLQVSRVRILFEDGKEVSRQTDSQWTAKKPVEQKIAYGTQLAVHTLQVSGGSLQYWKVMTVYATSYSPCNSGGDRCYPGTSLGLPVKKGVIAVTSTWYRYLAGTQVYIPGYGKAVIADIGAGISGTNWIDLGFSDSDYETIHQNMTIYFLTPAPSPLPWNIP